MKIMADLEVRPAALASLFSTSHPTKSAALISGMLATIAGMKFSVPPRSVAETMNSEI
jgi:hypothetical protein